jgi:putative ABC transport system permease protein
MRTTGDPSALVPGVRAALHTALPGLILPDPQTYETLFARMVAQQKFTMYVLALFGLLAIVIAAAGIYGVMAYIVEQRTAEIGVRIALGAEPSHVVGMVLSQAALCMAAGLVAGLAGGWILSRSVQGFLFRIDAHDPRIYAASTAVLIAAGLVAALVPAWRAARIDPLSALRAP